MYLEFVLFVAFVFFAVLDARYRQIKAYWFAVLGLFVISYKLIFELDSFASDGMMFLVSTVFVGIAFACRLFGPADLIGILILSFAVPAIGPIPIALPLLIVTLTLQNYAIIISNLSYNISDISKNTILFSEMPNTRTSRLKHLKVIYWHCMARRKRENDRFVCSAQTQDQNGIEWLSVKRGNKLSPETKYVFSAHPQFVYSTAAYCMLWFVSLSF